MRGWLLVLLPLLTETIQTSAAVSSCSHGGVLLPNATCACKPFNAGPSCEIVQCHHEGILIGGRCSCPPGVTALNCEPRKCLPAVASDFSRERSSLILVINQDIVVAQYLMALLQTLYDQIAANQYSSFIVANYLDSSKGSILQKKEFISYSDMLVYIEGISLGSSNGSQPTNRAILTAQSFASTMSAFSDVIVLTASTDSEASLPTSTTSSQNSEDRLIFKSLAWRNRIYYFIPNAIDKVDSFHRVAKATFGDVFYVDAADIESSPTIFDTILPSLSHSEVVAISFGSAVPLRITGTQYGNVTLLVTVQPGTAFPQLRYSIKVLQGATYKYTQIFTITDDETLNVMGNGSWVIKALAPTTTTMVLSHSLREEVDVGDAYLTSGMNNYLTGQSIGFSLDSLKSVETAGMLFDQENYNITIVCTFPVRFGIIESDTIGGYTQKITFRDSNNVDNIRVIPGFAYQMNSVYRTPFQCFNGGKDNGDGTCTCPHKFNGAPDCSVPNCDLYPVNQFPGNGQELCVCPQGVTGDFCDRAICYPNPNTQMNNSSRTLAVVIQATWSQAQYNDAIVRGLLALMNTTKYNEFVLTTFDDIRFGVNDTSILNTTVFYSQDDFISAVDSISYSATFVSTLYVLKALNSALNSVRLDKSPLFVFLDDLPANTTMESIVIANAVSRLITINVVGSQPYGNKAKDLSYYQRYAFGTGGLYVDMSTSQNETGAITQFLSLYGSVFPKTEVVSEQVPNNCTSGITDSVMLQPGDPTYIIVNSATSTDFSVKINGQSATSTSSIPTLGIYEIPGDLFADHVNNINVEAQTISGSDMCSWKIITQTNEALIASFMPLGSTKFTKELDYGTAAYLPTVYSTSNLTNTPGSQNAAISIFSFSGIIVYSNTAEVTQNCAQQAPFTTPFGCTSPNDQYIIKTIITLPTYSLQRSQRAYCFFPYQGCLNGGFWSPLSQQCYCQDEYYGGAYCEVKKCRNNGTILNTHYEGLCSCPAGYTGEFCETRVCPSMNFMGAADVRESDYEQLVFVVNTNVDMLLVSIYLKNLVQNFTGDTADSSNPRQYTLVTFDEANVSLVSSTFDAGQFQSDFVDAMASFSKQRNVSTRALDALHQALLTVVQPSATIFLITGSNSANLSIITHIFPKQRLGAQINLVYAPQGAVVPPQPSDPRLSPLARLTGGRILPLTQNSLNIFNKIVDEALVENALVYDGGWEFCSQGVMFTFPVESKASRIILDITGDGVKNNVNITDSRDTPTSYKTRFSDSGAIIVSIDLPTNIQPGSWNLYLKTNNGSCYLQVRAVSPIRVIPGYTSIDKNYDDFPTSEPLIVDQESRAAFRLSGDPGAVLTSLEIVPMDNLYQPWSVGKSDDWGFIPRADSTCSYQFVTEPFTWNNGTSVKVITHGTTSDGTHFTRAFYYELPMPDIACELPNGQRDQDSGMCNCNEGYFGDDCFDLLCQNGGTSSFGVCACADGYLGEFCEKYDSNINGTTTTTQTSTTTVPTMVTTIGPTTEGSTTTGTTTLGPCSPNETTYYFSFFIDTTFEINLTGPGPFYVKQHQTVLKVGQTVGLGSHKTETLIALSGVREAFYKGGAYSTTNDIESMFNTSALYTPASPNNLNLINAINFYLNSTTYHNIPSDSDKPGFAVMFAQTQPTGGNKEYFVNTVQRLKNAGYTVLGLVNDPLSGILDPTDYFVAAMGAENVYTISDVDSGAWFINKRACQLKPA